ncbi:Profilin [Portunus trituberculatus]|uniref:Profilin n=1 Tax=Portunus trituberculatus TaxID=210409 RepID=A0A5B7JYW9_PORTR|nr:Profilin [Portunus trituberculatus]
MSWNSYIENLISSSHVQKAAIYGLDGSKWAASEGFEVSKEEFDAIKAGFNDTKNFSMSGNWTSHCWALPSSISYISS